MRFSFFVGMERWWQNAISPIRRMWIRVASRLGIRKNGECCSRSISAINFFYLFILSFFGMMTEKPIDLNRWLQRLRPDLVRFLVFGFILEVD